MPDGGYFLVERKLMTSLGLREQGEPVSRTEAWLYLIARAAYEPTTIAHKGREVELGIGDTLSSIRELSEAWCWSLGKVSRYLKKLEADGRIKRRQIANQTIIQVNPMRMPHTWNYFNKTHESS